jgi:uncharacterized Zn finger protein
MFKLFRILIYGHDHKYEIIKERRLESDGAIGVIYVLRCKNCGDIKKIDLI